LTKVPASSGYFTAALDATGSMTVNTPYGFFPSVKGPSTPNPTLEFNGPYLNYSTNTAALTGMYQDGSTPMTVGAFVCQTAASATGSGGGSGGGSQGGGANCGAVTSRIKMADGLKKPLSDLRVGDLVYNKRGKASKVKFIKILFEDTFLVTLSSGKTVRCAQGHAFFDGRWVSMYSLVDSMEEKEYVLVLTVDGMEKVVSIGDPSYEKICKIELASLEEDNDEDHIYQLDDIWTHNIIKPSF
jgi:hypothetical protein